MCKETVDPLKLWLGKVILCDHRTLRVIWLLLWWMRIHVMDMWISSQYVVRVNSYSNEVDITSRRITSELVIIGGYGVTHRSECWELYIKATEFPKWLHGDVFYLTWWAIDKESFKLKTLEMIKEWTWNKHYTSTMVKKVKSRKWE